MWNSKMNLSASQRRKANDNSFKWDSDDDLDSSESMSSDDDHTRKSKNYYETVTAQMDDDDNIQVGESLFTDLCETWLNVHGSAVIEKILQKRKTTDKKPALKKSGRGGTIKVDEAKDMLTRCPKCQLPHTTDLDCTKLLKK